MYICPKCLECFANQYELFEHFTLCGDGREIESSNKLKRLCELVRGNQVCNAKNQCFQLERCNVQNDL